MTFSGNVQKNALHAVWSVLRNFQCKYLEVEKKNIRIFTDEHIVLTLDELFIET